MDIVPPDYLELSADCKEFLLLLSDTRCRDFVPIESLRLCDAIVSLVCSTSLVYVFLSKVHRVEPVLSSYNTLVHNKRRNTFIATMMADMHLIYRYNIQQEMRQATSKESLHVCQTKHRMTLSTDGGTWIKGITHIRRKYKNLMPHLCRIMWSGSIPWSEDTDVGRAWDEANQHSSVSKAWGNWQ